MPKEKAILIAASQKRRFRLGFKEVGSVLAHAAHIEKAGAVLWNIVVPGTWFAETFPHSDIKRGYFYNVSDRAVTHVFDIEYIKAPDEIVEKRGIYEFLITPRKIGWKESRDSFYWMKITNIYRLKRSHPLHDFKKQKDQLPLSACRNYVIIMDPHFQHYNNKITRREIMSDYIGDLLRRGKVTEKDIEVLFSYRLADKLTLVERQGSFKRAGRLDLLFENRLGTYILYELKKGVAKLPALEQIKRYMKHSKKKHKIGRNKLKGILLAQSIDPELYEALGKETNIKAERYSFKIEVTAA